MAETETFEVELGTSGRIPISEIVVRERQRKEFDEEHVRSLADSIRENGLLQDIVLHKNEEGELELVAGFNRIQAMMLLGQEEISYKLREDLTPIELKLMELEENIRRKDLEWWERANAIAEIHDLRREIDPDWTTDKTAAQLGITKGHVSKASSLSKDLKSDPKLREEKSMLSAYKKQSTKRKLEKRKKDIETIKKKGGKGTFPAEVRVGDALELIQEEPDESFDAVITNFPFGVDLELKSEGAKQNVKPYEDDEAEISQLVRAMVPEIWRVLKDDSWFIGFFDVRKITYSTWNSAFFDEAMIAVTKAFKKGLISEQKYNEIYWLGKMSMGLTGWCEEVFNYVTVVPAVWIKPNKTQGIIGDPRKGLIVAYEALIFAAKGDAVLLKQGLQNIFIFDTPSPSERIHPLQMPDDLSTRLVEMVSLGGGRILDPFAGSGSIGIGALNKQCEFVGFELDPEKASNGNLRLREHVYADELHNQKKGEDNSD